MNFENPYNTDLKMMIRQSRIYQYELASMMGLSESQLSKMLNRRELTDQEQKILRSKIEEIKEGTK